MEPWKLGLDLVGGSHLVYQIDLSNVSSTDQASVVSGLRNVIEKRVNLFGVSEPDIYTSQSGNQAQLFVDLAGINNVSDAINEIGQTPLLQFETVIPGRVDRIELVIEYAIKHQYIQTNLTGQYITGAQLTFDPTTNAPEVTITFNSQGAQTFPADHGGERWQAARDIPRRPAYRSADGSTGDLRRVSGDQRGIHRRDGADARAALQRRRTSCADHAREPADDQPHARHQFAEAS